MALDRLAGFVLDAWNKQNPDTPVPALKNAEPCGVTQIQIGTFAATVKLERGWGNSFQAFSEWTVIKASGMLSLDREQQDCLITCSNGAKRRGRIVLVRCEIVTNDEYVIVAEWCRNGK